MKLETDTNVYILGYSRLKRGLSKTTENVEIVTKARDIVLHDIAETTDTNHFLDTPEYTFVLPDLTSYSSDFRAFLHKDLIETSTLVSLEQAGAYYFYFLLNPPVLMHCGPLSLTYLTSVRCLVTFYLVKKFKKIIENITFLVFFVKAR